MMAHFNINNSKVRQVNAIGDNIELKASRRKSVLSRFLTLYGFIAATISIISGILAWYIAHLTYGAWFFGVK
jgi:hypothetical protein